MSNNYGSKNQNGIQELVIQHTYVWGQRSKSQCTSIVLESQRISSHTPPQHHPIVYRSYTLFSIVKPNVHKPLDLHVSLYVLSYKLRITHPTRSTEQILVYRTQRTLVYAFFFTNTLNVRFLVSYQTLEIGFWFLRQERSLYISKDIYICINQIKQTSLLFPYSTHVSDKKIFYAVLINLT